MWWICGSGGDSGLVWCQDNVQRCVEIRDIVSGDGEVLFFETAELALDHVRNITGSTDGYYAATVRGPDQ